MTPEEFEKEYRALAHAIQTGAYCELTGTMPVRGSSAPNVDPLQHFGAASPKHLRTGLNCVMADLGTLTQLLVEKGVLTWNEVHIRTLAGLRREVATYEQSLSKKFGKPVTLA